ncbi:hypothetical protein TALC_01053 [Thermoplasmatales archaeon BRNA1]|nr:hypothetical protein TALC_01053 [Thermoplasmatales archaeon BRNA1]
MKTVRLSDPTEDLHDCVSRRYLYDTVINGKVTLLMVILPIIVAVAAFLRVDGLDDLDSIGSFGMVVVLVFYPVECLVISSVAYCMYNRLRDHSIRDDRWREDLIRIAESRGARTSPMKSIDAKCRKEGGFVWIAVIRLLLILITVYVIWVFFFFIPEYYDDPSIFRLGFDGFGGSSSVFIFGGWAVCTLIVLLSILKILIYPHWHESRQGEFTREFQKAMGEKGLNVPRMNAKSGTDVAIDIILTIVTLGLFLVFLAFDSMNAHIKKQWTFEQELVEVLEGKRTVVKEDKGMVRSLFDRVMPSPRVVRRDVVSCRMPSGLLIAELFFLVVCAVNMLRLFGIACDIYDRPDYYSIPLDGFFPADMDFYDAMARVLMTFFYILNLVLIVYSMAGIPSRKPAAWKKVTFSCITFAALSVLGAFAFSSGKYISMFEIGPAVSIALAIAVIGVMLFSSEIRKFYTPFGEEVPPTSVWAKSIITGGLFDRKDRD